MNPLRLALLLFILFVSPVLAFTQATNQQGEFYQITIYHFANSEQQALIDKYLKDAYLPALHRQQIKQVGVFTAMSNDTAADKRLYVIVPLKSTCLIMNERSILNNLVIKDLLLQCANLFIIELICLAVWNSKWRNGWFNTLAFR